MAESFNYVKQLINAERYKDYKKDFWAGCDVVIISEAHYKIKKESITNWKEKSDCRNIVKAKEASSIIWLIENLKPYINCDYLNKYEYYSVIADFINQSLKVKKSKINEKELLLSIIDFLEKQEPSWEKILNGRDLDRKGFMDWYNFGVEHNSPFFVKFVALWMAFNEQYNEMDGISQYHNRERNRWEVRYGVESEKINEFCDKYSKLLESIHDSVFSSDFIKVFMEKSVWDMKQGCETSKNRHNYEFLTKKTGIEQTKALLQTIYQVRCNLFHGGKSPNNKRDIELVLCSGEIMEMYMKAIFHN